MDKSLVNVVPIEETPEVKSFIYQQIVEFEPFLTASSRITVVSKEPKNRSTRETQSHRILISIKEGSAILVEEGSSENIYEAIIEAKNKLFKKLVIIQDRVISEKDRMAQIVSIRSNINLH